MKGLDLPFRTGVAHGVIYDRRRQRQPAAVAAATPAHVVVREAFRIGSLSRKAGQPLCGQRHFGFASQDTADVTCGQCLGFMRRVQRAVQAGEVVLLGEASVMLRSERRGGTGHPTAPAP